MRKLIIWLIAICIIIGFGTYYYTQLDKNYVKDESLSYFPVPKAAILERETEKSKSYKWEPAKGTDVPLSYRLMITKSGWKEVDMEGANILYEKNGEYINLGFATDYIDLMKEER